MVGCEDKLISMQSIYDLCVLGDKGDPGYIPGPRGPPGKKGFPGRPGAAKSCLAIVHNKQE